MYAKAAHWGPAAAKNVARVTVGWLAWRGCTAPRHRRQEGIVGAETAWTLEPLLVWSSLTRLSPEETGLLKRRSSPRVKQRGVLLSDRFVRRKSPSLGI